MKIFGKEFKLFNYNKDGKGVKKEPEGPKNLSNFFKHFANKFTRLVTVNMYYVFGNFPLLFLMLALSGNLNRETTAPAYEMFAPLDGLFLHGEYNPVMAALGGVFGVQSEVGVPTVWTYICFALSALVIFTFGYVNTGTTYILRNMIKGEPIFMWDDFWYAIKRNKRQGMLLGILDALLSFLCVYNILFYYYNIGNGYMNFMFYASLLISALWFFMRFYMYIIMITFDLSLFKILKNALIFALVGIKRNIMAALGIAAMVVITYMLMAFVLPIGIIIPFVLLFADCSYMACYAAFPKIKEIMIDPYYKEEERPIDDEERIFTDLG